MKVHERNSAMNPSLLSSTLLISYILLTPFTIDPYGALGYFACKFLFLSLTTTVLLELNENQSILKKNYNTDGLLHASMDGIRWDRRLPSV
jgi:hypothetical protein